MENQVRGSLAIIITGLVAATALLVTAVVSAAQGLDVSTLTRDPAIVAEVHPLTGVLSNLSILLWCAAASVCLLGAWSVRGSSAARWLPFLLASGLLTMYLMLDDMFMIHEDLGYRLLGVSERAILGSIMLAAAVYFIWFRRAILSTRYASMVLALTFLSGSVFVDVVNIRYWPGLWRLGVWEVFIEDGLKWLGIAFWCCYFFSTTRDILASMSRSPAPAVGASVDVREQPAALPSESAVVEAEPVR